MSPELCPKADHLHCRIGVTRAHTQVQDTAGTGTEEVESVAPRRFCACAGEEGGRSFRMRNRVARGRGGGETTGTAVETARFPGMPRGGGVGSNEFE